MKAFRSKEHLCLLVLRSVVAKGVDVKTKTLSIEVDLVVALLEDGSDVSGVLELTQLNVTAALLDGITNQLGGTGFTLSADNHGLLLLAGLVDDEGSTLCFLLGYLLGFDCGGKFGREGKVLETHVSKEKHRIYWNVVLLLMRHRRA